MILIYIAAAAKICIKSPCMEAVTGLTAYFCGAGSRYMGNRIELKK
jgi:hypothetical protein